MKVLVFFLTSLKPKLPNTKVTQHRELTMCVFIFTYKIIQKKWGPVTAVLSHTHSPFRLERCTHVSVLLSTVQLSLLPKTLSYCSFKVGLFEHVAAENLTQVLCKGSQCSQTPSHPSSPTLN